MHLKKYFIGNWKMNGTDKELKHLKNIEKFVKGLKKPKFTCIFCLPFTILESANSMINPRHLKIGAQDVSHHVGDFGPFTGSISSKMIKNTKSAYVMIGHSEKRADGDTDEIISKKIFLSSKNSLKKILCVGENLEDFKNKKSFKIVKDQIKKALKSNRGNLDKLLIAYEPLWSIGTGIVPKEKYLKEFYKKLSLFIYNEYKKNIPLLYGGSVSSKNIQNFRSIDFCSGFLIGGASLNSKDFIDIIKKYYN